MTTLTGAPPVSAASADLMSLAPPPVSGEVYNDAKLLIEGLNKHAGPESYAVVIARFKKSKKGVDRIVYIRCDREGKARLTGFGRRIHSGTRLMECPFSAVGKRNEDGDWYLEAIRNGSHNHTPTLASAHPALRRLAMTEEVRESISSLIKVGVKISHEQEVKGSEVKNSEVKGSEVEGSEVEGSEVDVLPHPLPSKRMQACLQRFICSEGGAETAILKLFKQCKITVKRLLRIICKPLNCLLNLVCN